MENIKALVKVKKFTLASFKKFVRENRDGLYVMVQSSFDGMTDCVERVEMVPMKAEPRDQEGCFENTLGIKGIWLVGDSRDWFTPFEDEAFIGVRVSNCCGSFTVAKLK